MVSTIRARSGGHPEHREHRISDAHGVFLWVYAFLSPSAAISPTVLTAAGPSSRACRVVGSDVVDGARADVFADADVRALMGVSERFTFRRLR